jgi:hypothetical protein
MCQMPDDLTRRATDGLVVKSFVGFEIKDADKGEIEAIIATLEVVDKDEDVIMSDAIKDASKVAMSSYGHDVVFGDTPVGKGKLFVEGNKAVFKGRIFLATQKGRETFEVLKEMGADQQWSFGFRILGSEVPEEKWKKAGARRILTKLDCYEVSPVMVGAGVGTHTVGVKAADVPAPEPDPAIEAARLETERKQKELQAINVHVDRLFKMAAKR